MSECAWIVCSTKKCQSRSKTARLIKGKKSTMFAAAELASVVRAPARSADHVEKMK